jgi:hypothetical protein
MNTYQAEHLTIMILVVIVVIIIALTIKTLINK